MILSFCLLEMSKSKRFYFRSFDLSTLPAYDANLHEYPVYGRETCSDTGRIHLQGFVIFKSRRNLCMVKRWLSGTHFERAEGSLAEVKVYCNKDGEFTEFGTLPVDTRKSVLKMVCLRLSLVIFPESNLSIRRSISIIKQISYLVSCLTTSPLIICAEYGFALFVKGLNKWWDGYINQDHVLISDIDQSH